MGGSAAPCLWARNRRSHRSASDLAGQKAPVERGGLGALHGPADRVDPDLQHAEVAALGESGPARALVEHLQGLCRDSPPAGALAALQAAEAVVGRVPGGRLRRQDRMDELHGGRERQQRPNVAAHDHGCARGRRARAQPRPRGVGQRRANDGRVVSKRGRLSHRRPRRSSPRRSWARRADRGLAPVDAAGARWAAARFEPRLAASCRTAGGGTPSYPRGAVGRNHRHAVALQASSHP